MNLIHLQLLINYTQVQYSNEGEEMVSELDKRKKAAEAKFAVGEELLFQAIVKRDSIVSKWIANKFFSMSEEDTSDFVDAAIKANLERPGDDDILEFFERIFKEKGLDFNQNEIIEQLAITYEQILEEESHN